MPLLLLLLAIQARAGDRQRPDAPVSVCDVLSNDPTKLNGKVVTIRALLGGTDEGTWLLGECKTRLVTKGLTWANTISVYVDESDHDALQSWERMEAKLRRLNADIRRNRVWVTVVGRLETRESMDDEVGKGPNGPTPIGFGHLNGSPAEINVISLRDVTVEPSKYTHRTR
jgi:hypothetical protein